MVDLSQIDHQSDTQFSTHPLRLEAPIGEIGAPPFTLAREGADLWEVAVAGDVAADHEKDLATHGSGFRRARTAEQTGRAQLTSSTALDLGLTNFAEYESINGPYSSPAIIVISKRNGLTSLMQFWNLRALSPFRFGSAPVFLVPVPLFERWLGFPEQFRSLLRRPAEFSPDVLLTGDGTMEQAVEVAHALGLVQTTDAPKSGHRFPPPPPRSEPFTFRADVDPRYAVVYERSYGATRGWDEHLFRMENYVQFDSPLPPMGGGRCLLRFESPAFDGLPRRKSIAERISTNATWGRGKLQLGVNIEPRFRVPLTIPTLGEALELVLAESVGKFRVSDKGQLALKLQTEYEKEGLHDPTTFRCIRALATPRSKALNQVLQQLSGESYAAIEPVLVELVMDRRRKALNARALRAECGSRTAEALEILASAGWAERGLRIKCKSCGLESFSSIGTANVSANCPGCDARGSFVGTSAGIDVHYRLHSLVDRASDQGVLPHLAAMQALAARHTGFFGLPGVIVEGRQRDAAEIDVVALAGGRLLAGEVKTSPAAFTDDEIRKDIRKSAMIGAEIHLMCALGPLTAEQVRLASRICRDVKIELLSISGDEIFATPASGGTSKAP